MSRASVRPNKALVDAKARAALAADMLRLGELVLDDGRPHVAVSFTDADGRQDILEARKAGVDIAELRVDLFARLTEDYVIRQAERLAGLPTIATIRHASESGGWRGDEGERIALFSALVPHVDGIDIELAMVDTVAVMAPRVADAGKLLILSHHNFQTTPDLETLSEVCRQGVRAGADIVKVAAMVHDEGDVAVLEALLDARPAPHMVVIGMGSVGLQTRIRFPAKGSVFTFAAKGERVSAPGQIGYRDMLKRLQELDTAAGTS